MDDDTGRENLTLSFTTPSQVVGKKTYAKPFQFDDHRDEITYLYARDGLALTLKETMLVMEKRYNFFATPRMYKVQLASWGLHKNTSKKACNTESQQVQVGTRTPPKHRAAGGKVPLSEDWVRELLRRVSLERAARGRTAPPVASLQLPDILRVPEHYMHYLRELVELCWEKRVVPAGRWPSNEPMNDWFGLVILACRLLEYGRVRQGFRVVNLCFDRFADIILRGYHPAAWAYGYIAGWLLGFQSLELGRSYARYARRLDAISDHPKPKRSAAVLCPLTPTFEPGGKGGGGEGGAGFSEISLLCGRPLCEIHLAELMRQKRRGTPGECEIVPTKDIPHFGDIRDAYLGIGVLRKKILRTRSTSPHDPAPEDDDNDDDLSRAIRDRDCRAWVCARSGQYDEAWGVLGGVSEAELARAYPDHPEYVISYYDSHALLARSDERQSVSQVVEAATVLIDLLKGRYGLADHRTIDAYADLEAYLRGRGCDDQAEEVRQDINIALDAVEEKMNAAHRSSGQGGFP
ncbi:clr5 domain-containing protein [Apiospora rasikravindrae]|uniref:Clr5 domain-containing protein n=1 Tax=Apiospora rasikravindrae TaxID=990691 RepID=A0ABR1S135_9PEZI